MIDCFDKEYAFLSNFYPSFIDEGKGYPTVEHYFQAMKTFNLAQHEKIRLAATPGQAKRFGRVCDLRADWEQVKDDIMLQALRLKFQDPELRAQLIATGDEYLVEGNTWNDCYWGVCQGIGKNRLGELLMQVREECNKNDD